MSVWKIIYKCSLFMVLTGSLTAAAMAFSALPGTQHSHAPFHTPYYAPYSVPFEAHHLALARAALKYSRTGQQQAAMATLARFEGLVQSNWASKPQSLSQPLLLFVRGLVAGDDAALEAFALAWGDETIPPELRALTLPPDAARLAKAFAVAHSRAKTVVLTLPKVTPDEASRCYFEIQGRTHEPGTVVRFKHWDPNKKPQVGDGGGDGDGRSGSGGAQKGLPTEVRKHCLEPQFERLRVRLVTKHGSIEQSATLESVKVGTLSEQNPPPERASRRPSWAVAASARILSAQVMSAMGSSATGSAATSSTALGGKSQSRKSGAPKWHSPALANGVLAGVEIGASVRAPETSYKLGVGLFTGPLVLAKHTSAAHQPFERTPERTPGAFIAPWVEFSIEPWHNSTGAPPVASVRPKFGMALEALLLTHRARQGFVRGCLGAAYSLPQRIELEGAACSSLTVTTAKPILAFGAKVGLAYGLPF